MGKVDFLTLLTNLLNVLNQELQYAGADQLKSLANLERVVGISFEWPSVHGKHNVY